MATAYSTLLGLALPVQGELSGTWGDTVNNYITAYLDAAVAGAQTLSTDADVTLTKTTNAALNGTSSQYAIINCTGARTVLRTITAPAASKIYVIINQTTGGFGVKLVGSGPTTGVTIAAGTKALVAWNGTDFALFSTTDASGLVPVLNGGTNASTGAAALVNLGARTSSTGSSVTPSGTTAERDGTPAAGYFRYNTTLSKFEGYGAAWGTLGGATGGGTDDVFYENGQTVTTSYTLTTGKNAMTAGTITINTGITVTVPTGATWSIV